MSKVACIKDHLDFEDGLKYDLIMEHPAHYAIFDNNGNYRKVDKKHFIKEREGENL